MDYWDGMHFRGHGIAQPPTSAKAKTMALAIFMYADRLRNGLRRPFDAVCMSI